MLFRSARVDHLDQTIRPALERGAFVICDRFADSTRAYQGALGNVDPRQIRTLEEITVGDTRPDLTIVLDLPPEVGMARANARRGAAAADRFESQDGAFHAGLRQAFLEIAREEPGRCVVVDAGRSPQEVADDIWGFVEARFFAPQEPKS